MSLNTFFHEPPEEGISYTVLRVAFCLTAAVWLVSLYPFLNLFYGAAGLCPPQRWAFSPAWVSAIWWMSIAAAGLVTWGGRFYRWASVVLFLGLVFFFKTPCRPDNYGDQIFVSLAFLMVFCPVRRGSASPWLHRTLRLYAGTLYLVPVLYRLGGIQWWNGTAAWTALADPSTSRLWQMLSRNPWLLPAWGFAAITYASLAFEASFPFLIWVKRLRLPIVVIGIVFHIAMGIVLDLGLFPLQMIVVLIGCLGDESLVLNRKYTTVSSQASLNPKASPEPPGGPRKSGRHR